jgi:hypothetical protein
VKRFRNSLKEDILTLIKTRSQFQDVTHSLEAGSVQDKKKVDNNQSSLQKLEGVPEWLQKSPRNSLQKLAPQVQMAFSSTQTAFTKLPSPASLLHYITAVQELKSSGYSKVSIVLQVVLILL